MNLNFMKSYVFISLLMLSFFTFSQESPLAIGEIHKMQSTQLNEERTLNIYLPPSYSDSSDFPVFYVLDGSMNEDFLHLVGLIQFFNLQFKMPEVIVVGIANVDRKRDFTFKTEVQSLNEKYPTSGHSEAFINFLKLELIPYVNNNFKVSTESYLIGQSLGGLLATEILLKEPKLFKHYLIVSPSLWWDNGSLKKDLPELVQKNRLKDLDVYISVGAKEHRIMRNDAAELYSLLKKAKLENVTIDLEKLAYENHATVLHQSIYRSLMKLFPFQE